MRARIVPLVVRPDGAGTAGCTVVKVGGGLLARERGLAHACVAIAAAHAAGTPLVVIGGGGPFADAVRRADAEFHLGDDAAHWMAVTAMDQLAHWLTARLPASMLVFSPYQAGAALDSGLLPVMAPAAWLRNTDTLPHSWDVTSDSLAAYFAGAIDAARLVLLKPTAGTLTELTDAAFAATVPYGLAVEVADVARPDLTAVLIGSVAGRR